VHIKIGKIGGTRQPKVDCY